MLDITDSWNNKVGNKGIWAIYHCINIVWKNQYMNK